jgi:pimeloyl-ACP methyl ester carboxylesterase
MSQATSHRGILEGTPLYVEDTGGDGRPVVLIHGWPLSGASWQEQFRPLEEAGHRVVVYDRRGFGRSEKPQDGYDYDRLADDLHDVLERLDVRDATLVGFSMGGGEVARYVARHGEDRIRGVVFAAAVPPYLMKTDDNPDGPLTEEAAAELEQHLRADRDAFFDEFLTGFFSAGEELQVTEAQRQDALALTAQADDTAALQCMRAWATTDFRRDLEAITVPALVLHGDGDGTVPLEGSGQRTHDALPDSRLHVIAGGPHGINTSHAAEFNTALLEFLAAA